MGTILFILLKIIGLATPVKLIDTPYDWALLCLLLAIEGKSIMEKFGWMKSKE